MAVCCEHGNKPLDYLKGGKFLDWNSAYGIGLLNREDG
jgi:hypothetical protein